MKTLICDLRVESEDGHADLIKKLGEIFPDGLDQSGWFIPFTKPIDIDSELAKIIFATMAQFGMRPFTVENEQNYGHKMIYRIYKKITYTHKDLCNFELLKLDCRRLAISGRSGEVLSRHNSYMVFFKDTIPKNVNCLYENTANCIGPIVREKLLASDICGYILRPTLLRMRGEYRENPELWELASKYYIREFTPKRGEGPCYDITRMEAAVFSKTDIAYLQNRQEDGWFYADLICNQRFFQWWYANKFKHVEFIPCNIIDITSSASDSPASTIPPPLPAA